MEARLQVAEETNIPRRTPLAPLGTLNMDSSIVDAVTPKPPRYSATIFSPSAVASPLGRATTDEQAPATPQGRSGPWASLTRSWATRSARKRTLA